MAANPSQNLWPTDEHALGYLTVADSIPHRGEGEAELLDLLPATSGGCSTWVRRRPPHGPRPRRPARHHGHSGRLLPGHARGRDRPLPGGDEVDVLRHDLDDPLPDLGPFDAVVSSFAIHHVDDARKQALYQEVFALLRPGGVFLNLEHVASPTRGCTTVPPAVGADPDNDDPSNLLAPVEIQLEWLRAIGFDHVDCHWKWREMALLGGVRPG